MSAQSTTIVQSKRSSNGIVWTVGVGERQPLVAPRDRIDRVDDGGLAERAQQRREARTSSPCRRRRGGDGWSAGSARRRAASRTRVRARPRRRPGPRRRSVAARDRSGAADPFTSVGFGGAGLALSSTRDRRRAPAPRPRARSRRASRSCRSTTSCVEPQLGRALQLQLARDRSAQEAGGLLQPGDHAVGRRVVADDRDVDVGDREVDVQLDLA